MSPSCLFAMKWHELHAPEDEHPLPTHLGGSRKVRKRKIWYACDQCRKMKVKCNPCDSDATKCTRCFNFNAACTFLGPSYKRGPPKDYILAIEQLPWDQPEALIGTILQCPDEHVQSVVVDLEHDDLAREILAYGPSEEHERPVDPQPSTTESAASKGLPPTGDPAHYVRGSNRSNPLTGPQLPAGTAPPDRFDNSPQQAGPRDLWAANNKPDDTKAPKADKNEDPRTHSDFESPMTDAAAQDGLTSRAKELQLESDNHKLKEESTFLRAENQRLQEMLEAISLKLESITKKYEDANLLSEYRGQWLLATQMFLTETDSLSRSELVQKVDALKGDINQLAASSCVEVRSSPDPGAKEDGDSEAQIKKKRRKRKKTEKEKQDKANKEEALLVVEKVKLLRERWQCSAGDGSEHCYWTHDDPTHLPLSTIHFTTWAIALLKNDPDVATLEMPPDDIEFNAIPGCVHSKLSPLQHYISGASNTSDNVANLAPAFHLHLPNNIPATLLGGASAASSNPPPTVLATPASPLKLLNQPHPGQEMSVAAFCKQFDLGEQIRNQLQENGYLKTKTFTHITVKQLEEMQFKPGQIASLQVAVEDWIALES